MFSPIEKLFYYFEAAIGFLIFGSIITVGGLGFYLDELNDTTVVQLIIFGIPSFVLMYFLFIATSIREIKASNDRHSESSRQLDRERDSKSSRQTDRDRHSKSSRQTDRDRHSKSSRQTETANKLYNVETTEPSEHFKAAWKAAGSHLQSSSKEGGIKWHRLTLNPPFLEHFSFGMGNQLFFVFVDAEEYRIADWKDRFLEICSKANATPCLMEMKKNGALYETATPGWGLVNVSTQEIIDPIAMISDEKIEMSEWEFHDFAVQVVRDDLLKKKIEVFGCQSNLGIDPSIWFMDKGEPACVIVREGRYPIKRVSTPDNIQTLKRDAQRMAKNVYFASVCAASDKDPFDPDAKTGVPLYRGHGMIINYKGIEKIEYDPKMYLDAFLVLMLDNFTDQDGKMVGSPEDWQTKLISYAFYLGLGIGVLDKSLGRKLLEGASTGIIDTSNLALGFLDVVKRAGLDAAKNSAATASGEKWNDVVGYLSSFMSVTSPETTGPRADEQLVKQRAPISGFIPGLRLSIEDSTFAHILFTDAVNEKRMCDTEELSTRIDWMKQAAKEIISGV